MSILTYAALTNKREQAKEGSSMSYPPLSLGPRLWRCPETTETLWKRSAACHIR